VFEAAPQRFECLHLHHPNAHERPEPPPAALFFQGCTTPNDDLKFPAAPRDSCWFFRAAGETGWNGEPADDRRARIEKTGKTPEPDRLPGALAAGAGAVAGHGARAHAESGHQRWRDAVQRGTALVAAFLGRVAQTQPLAARRALGIQALNRSARQGMHRSLRCGAATRQKHSVNKRNSARMVLVSQEKYPLLVGVHFPEGFAAPFRRQAPRREESLFVFFFGRLTRAWQADYRFPGNL
jgi:hypothetical protein